MKMRYIIAVTAMAKQNRNPNLHQQTFHGTCVDISFEGKGVVKSGDDVYFVSGVFPGEDGEFAFDYARGKAKFGRTIKLDKISPERVEPRCKICSSCGGCSFQQLSYEAQLRHKSAVVKEQFRKIAKMDVEVQPTIGMENPYFYRNKIQMPFGLDKKGNPYCGFYKEGTHVIVPIEKCYIEDERAEHILSTIKKLLKSFRIPPYIEDERYGVLRHALIRTSYYKKEIMLVLVTAVDSFPGRNNFVKALVKECPEITTVVQNINTRATNVILGDKEHVLYGKGFIEDSLCGVNFQISAKSFYQTNPVTTEKLYTYAMESGMLRKDEIAFDAYSGIGTIGLIASKYVKEVISVEIVPAAVRDGIKNAKRNGISNFKMYCDDASSFMVNMAKNKQHVDVLFMDPPRKGSDERFLNSVLKLRPSKIVYVSCDPSTLARDIAYINQTYKLEKVQPFDMFPHTTHVETVAMLTLREPKK
jgi:23S rRNA (uracil1939-C5)-methyltransferase